MKNAGAFGPLIGAVVGLLPQCGFSAAASNLYAARVISAGSLIAVYLSTSDEMLPLLISNRTAFGTIIKILAVKVIVGLVAGITIDLISKMNRGRKKSRSRGARGNSNAQTVKHREVHSVAAADHHRTYHERHISHSDQHNGFETNDNTIHDLCKREHCDCEKDGIFISALKHSLRIIIFVLIITFAMNVFMNYIGQAGIQYVTIGQSYGIILLASLFGLIPNCGVSVALTQLYLGGMIGEGALMSGLLVGAGVGLLVLLRVNRPFKDTVRITCVLWAIGILAGCLIKVFGITFV